MAFQDGIDSNDGVFNGFFTGPINTWNETTKNGEMFTLKNAFTGVATSDGHATEIKTNFNPTGSTSTVIEGSGETAASVYHYQNFTVAAMSGITGVGTGENQIDASDIILF